MFQQLLELLLPGEVRVCTDLRNVAYIFHHPEACVSSVFIVTENDGVSIRPRGASYERHGARQGRVPACIREALCGDGQYLISC